MQILLFPLLTPPSLDFSFLQYKMKGRKISTLTVSIFSLYQPQAMVILKDGPAGEQNQG